MFPHLRKEPATHTAMPPLEMGRLGTGSHQHGRIFLNPGRSAIWHAFRAPKHRSRTERVLSIVLPRGPSALPNSKPPSWIVTAVWAPVPTSTSDELDGFWDEVTHETAATEVSFSPPCTLTHALGTHTHTLHIYCRKLKHTAF